MPVFADQSAFERAAASGGDERNGTERIRGEPQSDGRALHPSASETRPISGAAARLRMCYSEGSRAADQGRKLSVGLLLQFNAYYP